MALNVCRALKVLCVAEDASALAELKRASVSAEWELTRGATNEEEALHQLHEERPHVLVVFGAFTGFIARALEAYPSLRVVSDRAAPGAVAVGSAAEIRDAVKRGSRSGGPVRS